MYRARGLVAITLPLQGEGHRFDSGRAHFRYVYIEINQQHDYAPMVEWYNGALPRPWRGFDSPLAQSFFCHILAHDF
jgi:hypothetical protein